MLDLAGAVRRVPRSALARLGVPSDRDLVVSFLFPPSAEVAGIVMAKRLRDWPHDVDVIANRPTGKKAPDPGSSRVAGPRVKRIAWTRCPRNPLKDWSVVEQFCAEGQAAIRGFEESRGRYRRLYSRAMMPASHVLAASYKIGRPSVRWTAEFSDPLLVDTHGVRRTVPLPDSELVRRLVAAITGAGVAISRPPEMFELVETLAFALADEVVFTNSVQRDLMVSRIPSDGLRERVLARAAVRPHPQPAPELYGVAEPAIPMDPGRVNLAYFGAFYTRRGVADLLAPFSRLTAPERAEGMLHLFTSHSRAVRAAVSEQGLDDCVTVHGQVGYLDSLALCRRMDWLLVADARVVDSLGKNPYLPSKLSDYRGSGTPVWALVEPGSPLSRAEGVVATPLDEPDRCLAQLRAILKPAERSRS